MSRPKLRLFPRPGDVHPGAGPYADSRPVEEKNRADARFSSGTGSVLASAPDQTGPRPPARDRQKKRREDEQADEASRESFPASDPPATY